MVSKTVSINKITCICETETLIHLLHSRLIFSFAITWPLQTEEFIISHSAQLQLRSRSPNHSRGSICSKYFSFGPRCFAAHSEKRGIQLLCSAVAAAATSPNQLRQTSPSLNCAIVASLPLPPPPSPPAAIKPCSESRLMWATVRCHIAASCFILSSPAASICISQCRCAAGTRVGVDIWQRAVSPVCQLAAVIFFLGTRRGHVCTCYFQEAGCERMPRCDSGWFCCVRRRLFISRGPSRFLAVSSLLPPAADEMQSCFVKRFLTKEEKQNFASLATLNWLELFFFSFFVIL